MARLCLCIPGLLHHFAGLTRQDIPPVPALEKLLAKSSCRKHRHYGFIELLAGLFNLQQAPGGDFPIAAITRLLDNDVDTEGIWMRADPVHLHADRHRLVLMDQTTFNLDQRDALVLANDVRGLLDKYGIHFEAPVINRWYIRQDSMPRIRTAAIHEVTGRDVNRYLPEGDERQYWTKLMNELQMCLHASRVNEERRQRGEPDVNSIWFWGCGRLPDRLACEWSRVYSDEEISRSCALMADVTCDDLPDSIEGVIDKAEERDNILLVISFGLRHRQYHDLRGWQDFIAYLESCWFEGIMEELRSGGISRMTLMTEGIQFNFGKAAFYKFWKRPKSLVSYHF